MDDDVSFKPRAERALQQLPEQVQRRIVLAVRGLRSEPRPLGAIKLQGTDDLWRIRVGDYRIVYTINDGELLVLVVRLGHRRDIDKS